MKPRAGRTKIRTRVLAAILIPVAGLLWLSSLSVLYEWRKMVRADSLGVLVELSTLIGAAVHELQKERGISGVFVGSGGDLFRAEMEQQRIEADRPVAALRQWAAAEPDLADDDLRGRLAAAMERLAGLELLRSQTDGMVVSPLGATARFTVMIADLLDLVPVLATRSDSVAVTASIIAYANYMHAKERAGQERAAGTAGFAAGRLERHQFERLQRAGVEQAIFLKMFDDFASPEQKAHAAQVLQGPVLAEVARLRQLAMDSYASGSTGGIDPAHWYRVSTERIDMLKAVEDKIAADLAAAVERLRRDAASSFYMVGAVVAALLLAMALLTRALVASITRPLAQLTETMRHVADGGFGPPVALARASAGAPDEVAVLNAAFTGMLEEIRCRDHQLRVLNEDLEQRVDERTAEVQMQLAERQKAEASLRVQEQRLQMILDNAADGIITTDDAGTVLSFNHAAESIFGYAAAEIVGRNVNELVPEPHRWHHRTMMEASRRGGETDRLKAGREVYGQRSNGAVFPLYIAISRFELGGRPVFTSIIHDLSEVKARELELRRAKEEAEDASRTKSEFLASMSHELRTPLNAIIGFADALGHGIYGRLDAPAAASIEHIRGAGQHLLELINDLLDIARIEAGRLELHEEPLDLAAIVAAAGGLVAPRAAAAGLALATDLPADLPPLRGDDRRIRQILLNLLSNAVKFTPAGGRIDVTVRHTLQQGFVVAVRDTGVGMNEAEIAKAMEPFGQIGNPLVKDRAEGTGLGLPLTRALVEQHGGTMELRSRRGAGTTVTLRFPATRAVLPAALMAG